MMRIKTLQARQLLTILAARFLAIMQLAIITRIFKGKFLCLNSNDLLSLIERRVQADYMAAHLVLTVACPQFDIRVGEHQLGQQE